MAILLLFLGGITIVVLMITSAKIMVEAKYAIREEEERQRKEEMKRFEEDMNSLFDFSKYEQIYDI